MNINEDNVPYKAISARGNVYITCELADILTVEANTRMADPAVTNA